MTTADKTNMHSINSLRVVRITHVEVEVDVREKFSLDKSERANFYLLLRDVLNCKQALILSTCNRTEIYYVHSHDLGDQIVGLLHSQKGLNKGCYKYFFEFLDNADAIKTLYSVAIGLESKVLGDQQIFGQVKESYQESTDLGFSDTMIHRIMHSIFYTHKQVCQQTSFKEGAASMSYNAVKLLEEYSKDIPVLVVGAGKMGEDVCRNLIKQGYKNITLTNRTSHKALSIVKELMIKQLDFSNLFERLEEYDAIISTVSISNPLFCASLDNEEKKFLTIDLGMPRNFSENFLKHNALSYHDIDDIGSQVIQTLEERKKAIPVVKQLIEENIQALNQWVVDHNQTIHLKKFKATLEQVRKDAMAFYVDKTQQDHSQVLDDVSKYIIQRIIKLPAIQLRQTCQREKAEQLGDALNELFNLEYSSKHN